MPTILRKDGYRFFFFSNEGAEPVHIHAELGGGYAKFWIDPIVLSYSVGFTSRQLSKLRNLVEENQELFNKSCMITSTESIPKAVDIWFTDDMLFVRLEDGREVGTPLEWFPSLRNATDEQKKNWRLIGNGVGIHWEELDEDLSVRKLIQ